MLLSGALFHVLYLGHFSDNAYRVFSMTADHSTALVLIYLISMWMDIHLFLLFTTVKSASVNILVRFDFLYSLPKIIQ